MVHAGQMKQMVAMCCSHWCLNARPGGFSNVFGCALLVVEEYFSCFQVASEVGTKDFYKVVLVFRLKKIKLFILKYMCAFAVTMIPVKS